MRIAIGRPINGIGINGDEYLLADDGTVRYFESKEEAKEFLRKEHPACGDFTDDQFEDNFNFPKEEDLDERDRNFKKE